MCEDYILITDWLRSLHKALQFFSKLKLNENIQKGGIGGGEGLPPPPATPLIQTYVLKVETIHIEHN